MGRYLEHLIPALDAAGARLTILAQHRDAAWLREAAPGSVVMIPAGVASRPSRLIWEQLGLPAIARRVHADVIFSPHYTMPLLTRVPVVVTLHDATFFSLPETHTRGKRLFFRTWIRLSLARAAAIVVPSEATRSEVLRWTGSRSAISVAYHGVNGATFHPPTPEQTAEAAAMMAPAEHWLAFLGTLEPRKNLSSLITAFADVAADDRVAARYPGLVLALAGGAGWDTTLSETIAASPVGDRIKRLGFVADAALPGLLGNAEVVVYPSLGEGFGLPVLEAMATSAAVLTTPLLALPEVGGDVAAYTDPDPASIAAALIALLLDDDGRNGRASSGPAQAARFTWAASALEHARVFTAAWRKN